MFNWEDEDIMIPDVPIFLNFLNSLTLNRPAQDDIESFCYLEIKPEVVNVKWIETKLWYKNHSSFGLRQFYDNLLKIMNRKGHLISEESIAIILCLYCFHPDKKVRPIESINQILISFSTEATLQQYFITPGTLSFDYFVNVEPFELGRLDKESLRTACLRADSDFYNRYTDSFTDRFAIERKPRQTHVINWKPYLLTLSKLLSLPYMNKQNAIVNQLVELYYEVVGNISWGQFWFEFRECQNILVAAGAPILNDEIFRQTVGGLGVSVFTRFHGKKYGFVTSIGYGMKSIDLASTDKRINSIKLSLEKKYSISKMNQSQMFQTMNAYAALLARASAFENNDQINVAFLHRMIALDMLFGLKNESTRLISQRTAVVVFQKHGFSFDKMITKIKELYAQRSKFVHEGHPVEQSHLDLINQVTTEVFYCLLRLQKLNSKLTTPLWLAQLDVLAANVVAGNTLQMEEYKQWGIEVDGE